MRKSSIELAAKIRDWFSNPHGPDEDLDQQLAEMIDKEFVNQFPINPDFVLLLENDIEAYRGALGYSVRADHSGKLSDGTTPQCGMCNSSYRAQCEYAMELFTWFQSKKYTHLVHRHDGSFRAVDESLNVSWETDRFELLADLIKKNPVTEVAP